MGRWFLVSLALVKSDGNMGASAVATVKPGAMHDEQNWLVAGYEIMRPDAKVGRFILYDQCMLFKGKKQLCLVLELSVSVGKIIYTTHMEKVIESRNPPAMPM